MTIMYMAGRVEVRIEGDDCRVFTGFRSFGWMRRISWRSVQSIYEQQRSGRNYGAQICLEGQDRLVFGTLLNESRRYFVLNALKHVKALHTR